jgi:hypothetical protein
MPDDPQTDFEPASGGWTRADFERVNHETAHALAAHVLNLGVLEVRIDRPINRSRRGPDPLGYCKFEKVTGELAWKHMLVALAPDIMEGKAPERPPSLNDAERGDELSVAKIAFELEISKFLFQAYCAFLEAKLRTPDAKRKGRALSSALLDHEALPGQEVERIFREAEAQGKGKAKVSSMMNNDSTTEYGSPFLAHVGLYPSCMRDATMPRRCSHIHLRVSLAHLGPADA